MAVALDLIDRFERAVLDNADGYQHAPLVEVRNTLRTDLARLYHAVEALVEQLQLAHDEMTDGGEGCDGGCSYEDALAIGRDALAGVTNGLAEPFVAEALDGYLRQTSEEE